MIKKTVAALLAFFAVACWVAVDVNTATAADLDSVKGIGPGTSSKMLEARKASPFKNWSDLVDRVPGIGDKRASKLSAEGLTVNGEAYKPGSTASATEKKPVKASK
jgi:competence protein ComEA